MTRRVRHLVAVAPPHIASKGPPLLPHLLALFAGHVAHVASERPLRKDVPYVNRVRMSLFLGGVVDGCPLVGVEVVITPATALQSDEQADWGVWAQVHTRPAQVYASSTERNAEPDVFDGTWSHHGNRNGGHAALAALFAPVLAWAGVYDARQASAPAAVSEAS